MFEQRLIGKFQDTLMRCFAAFLFELLIRIDIFVPFRKIPNVAIEWMNHFMHKRPQKSIAIYEVCVIMRLAFSQHTSLPNIKSARNFHYLLFLVIS